MRLRLVFLTVFVIAACGLGYELVAGTSASQHLGDTVTQFSTAIGLYLFAMGVGAYLSKFLDRRLVERFVDLELAVAVLGGTSAWLLQEAYGLGHWVRPLLYGELLGIGTLVGVEIPLLLRILKDELEFKDLVAKVLSFDYVGALVVSLAFPALYVLPGLGLIGAAFLFGLLNALVALWGTWIFGARIPSRLPLRVRSAVVSVGLLAGLLSSEALAEHAEGPLYADEIVYAKSTPYQRIVVTSNAAGFQLFLNGALQFSSADEYRYHEALVHPAFAIVAEPRRVLVLGGGDGLAVREVLRHPEVERVTLVDIDAGMTALARDFRPLADLNGRSLSDPRVTVVNDDAMRWLEEPDGIYDVAIVDFPDPSSFSVGKLYTTRFYARLAAALAPDGALVVQATSPLHARRAYWCVVRTIEASDLFARPYRGWVPSFGGDWGFVLAARRTFEVPARSPAGVRHVDAATMRSLFQIPPDLGPVEVDVNRLNNQVLVRYYEDEWAKWNS